MNIDEWWPALTPETRQWLIDNNGDAVPDEIVAQIVDAGGPSAEDDWWVREDDEVRLGDDAIDWIEAFANSEEPDNA